MNKKELIDYLKEELNTVQDIYEENKKNKNYLVKPDFHEGYINALESTIYKIIHWD